MSYTGVANRSSDWWNFVRATPGRLPPRQCEGGGSGTGAGSAPKWTTRVSHV